MNPIGRLRTFGLKQPALLGLSAMMLLLLVFAGLGNIDKLPALKGRTFHAIFADANGLTPGTEVRIAGVTVGKVDDIALRGNQVLVTFSVHHATLGDATTASIEVKTILGQHYLSLSPAGANTMAGGDTIPVERTTTPLSVVPALQGLTSRTSQIDDAQAAKAFDALAQVMRAAAPNTRGTLIGLTRLSRTVSSRDAELRRLFAGADKVTQVFASRTTDLAALLTSSDRVLATLNSRRAVITQIIQATSRLATSLRGLVADNRATLGPALTKLNRVLTLLEERRDDLDASLKATAIYGRIFSGVAGSGRFFDGSLTFPRGYAVCSSSTGGALSDVLDPVLSQLNSSANGSTSPCLPLGTAPKNSGR